MRFYFEHPSHFLQDKVQQQHRAERGAAPLAGPTLGAAQGVRSVLPTVTTLSPCSNTCDTPILVFQGEFLHCCLVWIWSGLLNQTLVALWNNPGAQLEDVQCSLQTQRGYQAMELEFVQTQKNVLSVDVRSSAPAYPSDDLFTLLTKRDGSTQNSFHKVCQVHSRLTYCPHIYLHTF